METRREGVHCAHCCVDHGCKYNEDSCPVVSGESIQNNPCEDCELHERILTLDIGLLTREKVDIITNYVADTDGLFAYPEDAMVSTTTGDEDDWFMTIPMYMHKDSRFSGAPDFQVKIHSDGTVFYENFSGCKFKFNNALAVYGILLTAVKE